MKMYTTPEQAARLIELGFETPKGWNADGVTNNINLYVNIYENPMMFNYSIGELLSFLPKSIKVNDCYFTLHISAEFDNWLVEYVDIAYG